MRHSHILPIGSTFILNKHTHPFRMSNPKYHCCLKSVIQLLVSILGTISHNFQFSSSTKGSLSKCLFETAHNASSSTEVDALKFRLVQHDIFYGGQILQDSSECLMMLIEIINKAQYHIVVLIIIIPWGFSIWNGILIHDRKIYCLRCMWTEISLSWV